MRRLPASMASTRRMAGRSSLRFRMEANRFTWVGPGNWWLVPQRRALQRVRASEPGTEPGSEREREWQAPEQAQVRLRVRLRVRVRVRVR